nr:response regulator [uncultured Desulfobacter sp.]
MRQKKYLIAFLAVFILAALQLESIAKPLQELTDKEINWLTAHPRITIGVMDNWPPMDFIDSTGTPAGIGIDYIKAMNRFLGDRLTAVPGPFPENLQKVIDGKLNAIMDITPRPDRKKFLNFTSAYLNIPHVIVGPKEGMYYESEKDLAQATLALEKGFFSIAYFEEKYPDIKIKTYPDTALALDAVARGEADAYAGNRTVAAYIMEKEVMGNIKFHGRLNSPGSILAIGTPKDLPELAGILEKALKAIPSAQKQSIVNHYVNLPGKQDVQNVHVKTITPRQLGELSIILLGIILLIFWILFKGIRQERVAGLFGSFWFRTLIVLGLCLFVVTISGLGWLMMTKTRDSTIRDMRSHLRLMLALTQDRMEMWTADQMAAISHLCTHAPLTDITRQLLADYQANKSMTESTAQADARAFFARNKKDFLYTDFCIISPDHRIISASDTAMIGKRHPAALNYPGRLKRAFMGETLFIPPTVTAGNPSGAPKQIQMLLISPVITSDEKIIAVISLMVDPLKNLAQLTRSPGRWGTDDIYAFDRTGKMVTPSRFDTQLKQIGLVKSNESSSFTLALKNPGGDLTQGFTPERPRSDQPLTYMAQQAIRLRQRLADQHIMHGASSMQENMQGYRDYRGVPVFGAWLWNPDLDLGLAAEIDIQEAMTGFHDIRTAVFIILGVTLVLSVFSVLFVLTLGDRTRKTLEAAKTNLEKKVEERTLELKENQELFSALLESAPDAMIVCDAQGEIILVNSQTELLLGYKKEELTGASVGIVFTEQGKSDLLEIKNWLYNRSESRENKRFSMEQTVLSKTGEPILVEISYSPIQRRTDFLTVASLRDISERKKVEKEILTAKEKAEEATRAKSDFLANMSHEIRTPMNAILGMSHLTLKTQLNPKQRNYIEKVHLSAQNLLGIINDILDFSKIEAGKLTIENIDFDLNGVLDNLSNLVSGKTREKGLELIFNMDTNLPVLLKGDPLRLGQILLNLVNNAIKFTPNGEIEISIAGVEILTNEATLRFEIRDTGIGLSQDQQDKLFQAFHQADTTTTRRYGGSGLGLSICKKLSEMMGGTIGVTSEPGKGSTFWFTARFGKTDQEKKTVQIIPVVLNGLKTLVVDDNQTFCRVMTHYLEAFSFDVETTFSGSAALEKIKQAEQSPAGQYDLIVMDCQMPGMDGVETAGHIENDMGLKKVPSIIMVTGHDRHASTLDTYTILVKPITPSMLFDAVMTAFGRQASLPSSQRKKRAEHRPENFTGILGARLLLVEDNEINQELAVELLEQEGFFVEVADNGQIGVEMVSAKSFDAVLMDLQMPVMDGRTATRHIRSLDLEAGQPPIIAMTADAMSGVKDEVLAIGMDDYVTKPINPAELFKVLVKWIKPGKRKINKADTNVTQSGEPELPYLKGIDTALGLNRVGQSKTRYIQLLTKFYSANQETMAAVEKAVQDQDQKTAVRLVHTVKGLAGTIGAKALQTAAASLENHLRSGMDSNQNQPLRQKFYKELEAILKTLARLDHLEIQEGPAGTPEKGETQQLLELLEALAPHIAKHKPKPAKQGIEKINTYTWPDQYTTKLGELSAMIDKYRFKDATAILSALISELK